MEEDPKPAVIPNPEPFKPEEPTFEKPAFLPPKPVPISHPPKISPSSIPNPSPSISTTKPAEPGFPNYGSYLYSIPGYSAFQPVSFPSIVQPHPGPVKPEPPKPDFTPFPAKTTKDLGEERLVISEEVKSNPTPPKQQDFEEHFTPEIIPAAPNAPNVETHSKTQTESKMSITSLTQGSGATVTIPNQVNKEVKKKSEKFSLKTSIPISKIDMKCVNTSVDTFQNSIKKSGPVFNPAFPKESVERPKVEIQSNIVIKTASKQTDTKEKPVVVPITTQNNSISTLINAAEAISRNDNQFRIPEPKTDASFQTPEPKKPASPPTPQPPPAVVQRPMFNTLNLEKPNFPLKPPEGGYNEQKNQILYIQNKAVANPKMVVTLQHPQNPQVLIQRTNFESKNLLAPSRLTNQSKKSKEDIVNDNGASSKVVALKRLHQDNCDENDFENLITENQIYGNKIVVKEKSQGTQQEQDLKLKNKEKQAQSETKNIVLQPSYVYVSNVQFPANLMMIKTNSKTCQTTDSYKTKVSPNENKTTEVTTPMTNNNEPNAIAKISKSQIVTTKDIHLLKSSNVLQTLSNNNNKKPEMVTTTNQKVVMSPQVTYQVMTDSDNKNQINKEPPKIITPKKELPELIEMKGTEKKMFIACQYNADSKLTPKLVIANIKPKIATKVEVVSTLDIYARRKRLRRLKYLSNNSKDTKIDSRKAPEKVLTNTRNIITPDKMKAEIFKEFANTKDKLRADNSESDSDYGEEELTEYNSIIEEYGPSTQKDKVEFLAGLRLATHDAYREKHLEKQDRSLKHDSVATAYITARLDRGTHEPPKPDPPDPPDEQWAQPAPIEDRERTKNKQRFLAQLQLAQVSVQYKEAYEKTWEEVIKERQRRNGVTNNIRQKPAFDPNSQLRLLTEIKNCVNINNNLIKKRLDPSETDSNDIRILAEKNFSELNRLSKMADRSVKLFSGQDAKKRDLNPGFDSENIQKLNSKVEPYKDYPNLIIPSISRIVSLKSEQQCVVASCTQATSMDEPESCARGQTVERTREVGSQSEPALAWPGVDAFIKSYREYEIARKREISSLHRHNTSLCVESAHVTRTASRHSDRARALLAEREHLAREQAKITRSLQRLTYAVHVIRNS